MKQTQNRRGKRAQKNEKPDRSRLEQRPNDKRSPEIKDLCNRSHPNIWSSRLKSYLQRTAELAAIPTKQDSFSAWQIHRKQPWDRHLCPAAPPRCGQPSQARWQGAGEARGTRERRGLRASVPERCAAQTAAVHFDNLITQLQLATGKCGGKTEEKKKTREKETVFKRGPFLS